jgi:hypothetical protein
MLAPRSASLRVKFSLNSVVHFFAVSVILLFVSKLCWLLLLLFACSFFSEFKCFCLRSPIIF